MAVLGARVLVGKCGRYSADEGKGGGGTGFDEAIEGTCAGDSACRTLPNSEAEGGPIPRALGGGKGGAVNWDQTR